MSISSGMPTLHASLARALHAGQNGRRSNCFSEKEKGRKLISLFSRAEAVASTIKYI